MKVTLKLTPAQVLGVSAIVSDFNAWITGEHPAQCPPQDQELTLEGQFLSWAGPRHCLEKNTGILGALQPWDHPVQVVSYETSDERLKWYETTLSFLQRAPLEGTEKYTEERPEGVRGRWHVRGWRFTVLDRADVRLHVQRGQLSAAKLAAQHSSAECALARKWAHRAKIWCEG